MSKLIRYWYNPQGIITRNIGGWRLGHLLKTGRKLYVIQPLDPQETRTKYRIDFTRVREVNRDGSAK